MDRQEPTLGKSDDLAALEFRRNRTAHARPRANSDLTWKIAIGVFLGLALFGLMTCTGLLVVGSAVQEEQERQAAQAVAEFQKAVDDPDPFGYQAREAERLRHEAEYLAPKNGERCIDGKRFRRVDNGWVQVNRPCR